VELETKILKGIYVRKMIKNKGYGVVEVQQMR